VDRGVGPAAHESRLHPHRVLAPQQGLHRGALGHRRARGGAVATEGEKSGGPGPSSRAHEAAGVGSSHTCAASGGCYAGRSLSRVRLAAPVCRPPRRTSGPSARPTRSRPRPPPPARRCLAPRPGRLRRGSPGVGPAAPRSPNCQSRQRVAAP
jgi:hypothetical protein